MRLNSEQIEFLKIPKALPTNTHYQNIRNFYRKSDWDRIRKLVYQRANYRCELCDENRENKRIEAHELWEFNFQKKEQNLKDIVALCPNCHRIQHVMLLKLHSDKKIVNGENVVKSYNKKFGTNYTFDQFIALGNEFLRRHEKIQWHIVFEFLK